jgi:hypothetical protein
MVRVLALDAAGMPARWLRPVEAACYKWCNDVVWELGDQELVVWGGTNAASGQRSFVAVAPIIALRGESFHTQNFRTPSVNGSLVFRRDRCLCAYCGEVFREGDLTLDHVLPESRGGPWTWTNLVTACGPCNLRKNNRTPEEARMALLYVPYTPSRHEYFILENRQIRGDQMEFLLSKVPRHSRLLC